MSSAFVFAGGTTENYTFYVDGTESSDPEPQDRIEVQSKEEAEATMKDVKPVLACRACLAIERPLRPISHYLADTLASLVGNLVQESVFYPKYICSFCHALLVKFNTFKDKCQSAEAILQHISIQRVPITLENIIRLAEQSPFPDFKMVTFVNAMPEEFNPRHSQSQSTQNDVTFFAEVPCKSEHNAENPDDEFVADCNDDVKSNDTNDSSDDEGFLINLVRNNRETDKKYNKNVKTKYKSQKVKNEHSKSKIKTEKKTRTNKKLVKLERDENGEQVNKKKIKQKLHIKTDKSKIEKKYNVTVVRLSESDQIKQIEARKDSPNYKGAIFKCDLCYHGFNVEATYKNHMAKHDLSRGDYECKICHLRYPGGWILTHHTAIAHTNDYVCNSCGAVSKSTTAAKHHLNWHKGIKYDCKICGKKFNKPNSVQGHMHWSHGGNVQCTICNKMCLGDQGLHQHMGKMHKKAIGAVCASCGVQFHSLDALQRHRPQGVPCDHTHRACTECGKGFLSEQLLEEHKREHHPNEMFCVQCDKHFTDRERYVNHMTAHVKPRPSKFTGIATKRRKPRSKNAPGKLRKRPLKIMPMKVDSSTDAGANAYVCEICGCHKSSKQTLRNHLMRHTGDKPYQCDYCDRRFIVKNALRTHIHSHMVKSGDADKAPLKDYHCRICNMKFNYQNNRRRHEITVHQQERRYSCELCGSTYKFSESLKQHFNTKHLGMPWPKRNRRAAKRGTTHAYNYNIT